MKRTRIQMACLAWFFQELKRSGHSNRAAGRLLGVPWQTLYRWWRNHVGHFTNRAYPRNISIQQLLTAIEKRKEAA